MGKKEQQDTYTPHKHQLESLARCFYPAIVAYFESEQGQKEFAAWKAARAEVEEGQE